MQKFRVTNLSTQGWGCGWSHLGGGQHTHHHGQEGVQGHSLRGGGQGGQRIAKVLQW